MEQPERKQCYRGMYNVNDSCGAFCNRYVFSNIPCDSIKLKNKDGFIGTIQTDTTGSKTFCFTCHEFKDNEVMMQSVTYHGQNFNWNVYPSGELQISGPYCSKLPVNLLDTFRDSVSVVIWHTFYEKTGILRFYLAKESFIYPYVKTDRIDSSFSYDLNQFCSSDERDEDRKSWQDLYERYLKFDVNPNPFSEKFELKVNSGDMPQWLISKEPKVLSFYDENGNTLLQEEIDFDTVYTFSFPDVAAGKMIFYKLNWSDCSLSGTVKKM